MKISDIQKEIDKLLVKAQIKLNAMSLEELRLDVAFMEFCASYGLVRVVA